MSQTVCYQIEDKPQFIVVNPPTVEAAINHPSLPAFGSCFGGHDGIVTMKTARPLEDRRLVLVELHFEQPMIGEGI